jgi:hypothetical protein
MASASGAYGSSPCRIIQHGLPSQAEYNAQVAAGREIYFQMVAGSVGPYPALARNGYTSDAGGSDASPDKCVKIIYWDGAKAQQMDPSTGAGPTPYFF